MGVYMFGIPFGRQSAIVYRLHKKKTTIHKELK